MRARRARPAPPPPGGHGFIGGAQLGYNHQIGSNFVVGLEADIQGAGVRGAGNFFGAGSAVLAFPLLRASRDDVSSGVEHERTVDWLGTVRGRLGYLVTPTLLAYVTGGLAYGGVSANTYLSQAVTGRDGIGTFLSSSGGVGHFSDTRVGWTVGGGLEWMFAPNWSLKGEYLYYDLGNVAWNSGPAEMVAAKVTNPALLDAIGLRSEARFDGHIARLGLNYHFGAVMPGDAGGSVFAAALPNRKGAPSAPPPVWTGLYAGLTAGYSWTGSSDVRTAGYGVFNALDQIQLIPVLPQTAASATGVANVAGHGYIGGGQFGYDHQLNSSFVVGLEADIQGAGIRGRGGSFGLGYVLAQFNGATFVDTVSSSVEHEKTVDWLGTVRGRVGYLATPSLLAYVTGGLAYGGVSATTHVAQGWSGLFLAPFLVSSGGVGRFDDTRAGWTVGGGLEWMFAPNWSLKGEYLYYDLGSSTWNSGPLYTSFNLFAFPFANAMAARSTTRFDGHIARAGVNYHFNLGAPTVAEY